jgi:TonB-dependent starch-binding outer membrane protein SusC
MKTKLLALLLLLSVAGYAQDQVSGKVTDENGDPLPGINVLVKATTRGTVTDATGFYSIDNLSTDATLVFSFIGYQTQEITISGKTSIDVKMNPDVTSMEEIVVVGYGTQKKSVATASLSKVDSKQLSGFSVARVDQMLQGQVSGVTFKSSSGQPGSGQNIFIRGIGTNGDNSPLIIIDGLVANDGILQSLNPSDIESVEVLKDGASTAIYGARGANGIIMVTTKKAKAGTATLNYNANFGTQSPWRLPKMLNASQYVELTREQFANDGQPLKAGFPDQSTIPTNTNWMDELFQPGTTQNHQLSVSKGSEGSSVYASVSYFEQKGVIAPEKSNLQRVTLRFNSENKINNYLSFGQNLFLVHSKSKRIPENSAFGSPIADAFALDPLTPVYDETAQFGFAQSKWVQKEYVNPFSRIFITNNKNFQDGATGNAYVKITPLKNLTFKSDLGFDYNFYTGESFSPSYELTSSFMLKSNSTGAYSTKKYRWQWENYINYNKSIGNHTVDIVVGTTIQERYDNDGMGISASSSGVGRDVELNPNFWYINSSPDSAIANTWRQERQAIQSLFGRLTYNYNEKYLLSATVRRDASTQFGSKNPYGIFPSFSGGWVVSKEKFFPESFVNFFKLRGSYGVNGNDRIQTLRYASTVVNSGAYQFGKPGTQGVYTGYSSTYAANSGIAWEESKQTDIGIEAGLWNDKLTLELDYYNKTTDGLLMTAPVLGVIGTNGPVANVGEVVNKGFELEATLRQSFGALNMRLGLTASTLKNNVTKCADFIPGYSWPVRNLEITRMEKGKPIAYFRGRKTDGIFRSQSEVFAYINADGDPIQPNAKPGDLKFVDANKDGKIDDNDMVDIGKPWADYMFGLNLSLDYKGIDLRVLFAASIGNQAYKTYERTDVQYNNFQSTWLDRWSESNPDGKYPRLTFVDPNGNQKPSDFYVEDASYGRIKNLQIGYSIPSALLQKVKITSFRIYGSVDNLLTITKYKGFDPEIGVGGNIFDTSIDKGFYPQMRSWSLGLNVSF